MRNIYYRIFLLTVTFYGIYVCNFAFFSDPIRDIKSGERLSEPSSKWIYVKDMKLNVSLEVNRATLTDQLGNFYVLELR